MTEERYNMINEADNAPLTMEEIAEGWHFCREYDCLLVGPGMCELDACSCWPPDHKVYSTIPQLEPLPVHPENPRKRLLPED